MNECELPICWQTSDQIVVQNAHWVKVKTRLNKIALTIGDDRQFYGDVSHDNTEIELTQKYVLGLLKKYPELSPQNYAEGWLNSQYSSHDLDRVLSFGRSSPVIFLTDKNQKLIVIHRSQVEILQRKYKDLTPEQIVKGWGNRNLKSKTRTVISQGTYLGDDWEVERVKVDLMFADLRRGERNSVEYARQVSLWEIEKFSPDNVFPLFVKGDLVKVCDRESLYEGETLPVVSQEKGLLVLETQNRREVMVPVTKVEAATGLQEIRRAMGLINSFALPNEEDFYQVLKDWNLSESSLKNAIAAYKENFAKPSDELFVGPKFKVGDRVKIEKKKHRYNGKTGIIRDFNGDYADVLVDSNEPIPASSDFHIRDLQPTSEIIPVGEPRRDIVEDIFGESADDVLQESPVSAIADNLNDEQQNESPKVAESRRDNLLFFSNTIGTEEPEELRIGDRFYGYNVEDWGEIVDFKSGVIIVKWDNFVAESGDLDYWCVEDFEELEVQKWSEEESRPMFRRKAKFIVPDYQSPVTSPNSQQPITKVEAKISDDFTTLTGCEKIVDDFDCAGLEAGRALHCIKYNTDSDGNELYKGSGAKTWSAYCRLTKRSRRGCDELIQAWKVSTRIAIPESCKIVAIASYLKLDRVLPKYQQLVIDRCAETTEIITAKLIVTTSDTLAESEGRENFFRPEVLEKESSKAEKINWQLHAEEARSERDALQEEINRANLDFEVRVASAVSDRINAMFSRIEEATGVQGDFELATNTLLDERDRMIAEIEELKRQMQGVA